MKTQKVINQALGGVLFIDEAYSILSDDNYSKECISTLIKNMEDNRNNLCVIMAGYSKDMDNLIKSNKGFESRINFNIEFPDYNADELITIIDRIVEKEHLKLNKNCKNVLLDFFNNEISIRKNNFSNGRLARNLIEKSKMEQATRIINTNSKNIDEIIADDITNAINKVKSKETKRQIGFGV